ncbi:MAG: CvpA family protein [Bacteroidales bacterium]|nr:CvpA family protein [Bacteroidales bacterium]
MKIVDTIVLLTAIWFAIRGFSKGFFTEIFSVLALLAGGWSAIFGQNLIAPHLPLPTETSSIVVQIVIFVLVVVAVFVLGKLCKTLFNFVLPDGVDKILGLLFGGFKILVLAGIIFHFVAEIDVNEKLLTAQRKESSITYVKCKAIADFLLPQLDKIDTSALKS